MNSSVVDQMNFLGKKRTPFLLITDFLNEEPLLYPLDKLPPSLAFSFPSASHQKRQSIKKSVKQFAKYPVSKEVYRKSFENVITHLKRGDSYLINLTMATPIEINLSLEEIFYLSSAKYKVHLPNQFTFFSPETFITVNKEGIIATHPMKGTIDASIEGAKEKILACQKESAEHVTIVDLLRNDLSIMADNVSVPRFRYIDHLITNEKDLLQVSSEIIGSLGEDWYENMGTIINTLLPAGSISGAPKPETIRIIAESERDKRGYYTGVTLLFDGESVDSCVNIRFIEQQGEQLLYRSGGGITHQSCVDDEYQEMVDKVYVPIN